jgi:hypothetical protein
MITPRFERYYEKSLTLKRLHDLGTQDNLDGYRQFADIAPTLLIRDMAVSADEEIELQQKENNERMDDMVACMDYLIKFHLLTASATLNFLDRFGSSTNPQMKELRELLVQSQRIFIKKHEALKKAGIVNEENSQGNVVDPDVFRVEGAEGN